MEVFIIVTVLWVFSVCLHEFGHAWAAYCGGDHSVKEKGYLTLNPMHYTEPVNSLLLPVVFMMMGGIGLPGGAVYIERDRLRSRGWETWVSLAGPAMNLFLILVISQFFKFGWVKNDPESVASVSLGFLLLLQVSALILNLIPVPPLDGFQAIAPWLPPATRDSMYAASNVTMLALFAVLWFVPPINNAFWLLVFTISDWMGVDSIIGFRGWQAFRFWQHGL
jgi:Zn-dependent protease